MKKSTSRNYDLPEFLVGEWINTGLGFSDGADVEAVIIQGDLKVRGFRKGNTYCLNGVKDDR